jgi:hypothetical protein
MQRGTWVIWQTGEKVHEEIFTTEMRRTPIFLVTGQAQSFAGTNSRQKIKPKSANEDHKGSHWFL